MKAHQPAPRSLRLSLAVGLAALALTGCSKPVPPRVTPLAATVVSVAPSGLRLRVDLDVYNPNAFPLSARSVDGTVSVGSGVVLGQGHAEPSASIAPEQSGTVSSELSIDWQNLAALLPFAASTEPVPYTFDGQATIGGEKLNVTLPFQVKGALSRTDLVNIGLAGMKNSGLPGVLPSGLPNLLPNGVAPR
ncbi:MAG TPA: LEA type 2 family protein [Polyangiaceae bacterium]|nr:LEA type 2 family protein [Polyangiaceae bacterium]